MAGRSAKARAKVFSLGRNNLNPREIINPYASVTNINCMNVHYFVFTIATLHTFQSDIFKRLKECIAVYFIDAAKYFLWFLVRIRHEDSFYKLQLFKGSTNHLSAYERDITYSELYYSLILVCSEPILRLCFFFIYSSLMESRKENRTVLLIQWSLLQWNSSTKWIVL